MYHICAIIGACTVLRWTGCVRRRRKNDEDSTEEQDDEKGEATKMEQIYLTEEEQAARQHGILHGTRLAYARMEQLMLKSKNDLKEEALGPADSHKTKEELANIIAEAEGYTTWTVSTRKQRDYLDALAASLGMPMADNERLVKVNASYRIDQLKALQKDRPMKMNKMR